MLPRITTNVVPTEEAPVADYTEDPCPLKIANRTIFETRLVLQSSILASPACPRTEMNDEGCSLRPIQYRQTTRSVDR
jgi:hypothetical protein